MTQNRKPPAYQEYAAEILTLRNFKLMSISERGLLYTIRLECWVNKEVPALPDELAKYIGCDVHEVKAALTQHVKSFLYEKNGSFTSPELDDYRQHLDERRLKQSTGGKDGAAITNAKKKATKDIDFQRGIDSGNPQAPRRGSDESLVKSSTVKPSQVQSLETGDIHDEWLSDYTALDE